MSVRSSPMPPTSCGARTAFGCSRWTTAGAGYSPPSSIGTPSASAGMCASEATASPPFSRSPWGLRGCMPRPPNRCGAGAGIADGSRLPVSVGPLHQPDQVLGHPAVLRLRRTAPDQRRRREVQSARSRNRSSMAASTATSRSCGRAPSAGSSNSTMPSGAGEERLPEPRSSIIRNKSHICSAGLLDSRPAAFERRSLCLRHRVPIEIWA